MRLYSVQDDFTSIIRLQTCTDSANWMQRVKNAHRARKRIFSGFDYNAIWKDIIGDVYMEGFKWALHSVVKKIQNFQMNEGHIHI